MDKEDAIERVTDNPYSYTTLSDELKANRDVVMATVSTMGFMLYDMEPRFKADKKIVMAAVRNDGTAIQFASPDLQEDKEVAMTAVRNNGAALHFLPEFKEDRDVVMAAITTHGSTIKYASHELQRDPDFIALAIDHGHIPTKEQSLIMARERSSKELHKYDAESEPFHQFKRGVRNNLQDRYAHRHTRNSTVGKLNEQGPHISEKILREISSYGPKPLDRGKFPKSHRIWGGTRRKRKQTKRR
jgi:Domain of unknown function (DUF4116)